MAGRQEVTGTPDIRMAWGLNEDAAQYAERTYRSFLKGAETVQSQALEVWNTSMRKGLDAMNEIAQCQTAAEAFGVQARFANEAMQTFLTESQKIIDQLAAASQTPWATLPLAPGGSGDGKAGNGGDAEESHATARRSSRRRS